MRTARTAILALTAVLAASLVGGCGGAKDGGRALRAPASKDRTATLRIDPRVLPKGAMFVEGDISAARIPGVPKWGRLRQLRGATTLRAAPGVYTVEFQDYPCESSCPAWRELERRRSGETGATARLAALITTCRTTLRLRRGDEVMLTPTFVRRIEHGVETMPCFLRGAGSSLVPSVSLAGGPKQPRPADGTLVAVTGGVIAHGHDLRICSMFYSSLPPGCSEVGVFALAVKGLDLRLLPRRRPPRA
ncbi:MAG: hypothetical protein JWM98_1915 [Thermoleophilia bacterium]|nr:hypothetical protein [Thermoleophilia bacterium]